MKVRIRTYSNRDNYEKDYPDKEEIKSSIGEAIEIAKTNIAKIRNTNNFLGFKIYTMNGELKYNLPSF